MNADLLLMIVAGGGVGASVMLAVSALSPTIRPNVGRPWLPRVPRFSRRIGVLLLSGAVVAVVSRSLILGALVSVGWHLRSQLGGGATEANHRIGRLEALATWVEALRDAVTAGAGLEQALDQAGRDPDPLLAQPLQLLARSRSERLPLPESLRQVAAWLDDGDADRVLAALIVSSQARGPGLVAVLRDLAADAREQVAVRRGIEASRRGTRRSATLLLVLFGAVGANLLLLNPSFLSPYRSAGGQLVLLLVAALVGTGMWVMRQLSTLHAPVRVLTAPTALRSRWSS